MAIRIFMAALRGLSFDCGAPYIAAGARAAKAVAENPGMSDRAIAAELGVSDTTVLLILVGLIAGWLAGQVMRGAGFGLIGDLIVGLAGAFIGDWPLPRLNIHLGVGIVALTINALIGAIVLLLILRLIGGRGWRYLSGIVCSGALRN